VPPDVPCTMPELIQTCLDRGEPVAAWHLPSDWIDVGTPADLARANGHA
jgi:NDP-sugar pyrophosphorylase family protein